MAQFKKGQSGNPNGRPRSKKSPNDKLKEALSAGYDLKKLKELGVSLITDENTKMSASQVKDIFKTLVDLEKDLLILDFKHQEVENQEVEEEQKEEKTISSPISLKMVK